TKNTLADGSLTLNGDVFFYDYKGYQISQIIDRTSINLNVDATVKGVELESTWEPIPGLRFNLATGYESSRINNGQSALDIMDRTNGHDDWMVIRPYVQGTSNCVLPKSVVETMLSQYRAATGSNDSTPAQGQGLLNAQGDSAALAFACTVAYSESSLFGSHDPGSILGV